ncbi:hypothetical protein MRO53_24960, partial [Escherichia coli]|nr:hypothetical protein [Escherichia coli]
READGISRDEVGRFGVEFLNFFGGNEKCLMRLCGSGVADLWGVLGPSDKRSLKFGAPLSGPAMTTGSSLGPCQTFNHDFTSWLRQFVISAFSV